MANNKLDQSFNFFKQTGDNFAGNLSGIFSLKPMAKYLSGARCVLKINNKIIGFAFAISWNIRTEAVEIETIDDYLPYEIAPQRISVNGTISGFRIPGSGPTQDLIQADIASFLHQRYVEIEVRDSQTDNIIFVTKKALITGRQENVRSDSLSDMSLTFKAIGWADERTPKKPDGVGESLDAPNTQSGLSLPKIDSSKLPF